jgi:hypothetical protein
MLSIIGILVGILVPILLYVLNKEKGEYTPKDLVVDLGGYFRLLVECQECNTVVN